MKRLAFVFAALFIGAVSLNAQSMDDDFGGQGGRAGGPGMRQGMGQFQGDVMLDPFEKVRPEYAARKTRMLTKALLLDEKQAKKVEQVYRHTDCDVPGLMKQMGQGRGQRGNGQGMRPEGGQRPEGMQQRPEGAQRGNGQGMRPEGGQRTEGGQRPEGAQMGQGRGPRGGQGMNQGGNMQFRDIPVSESEKEWREKKMKKILTAEQFAKWSEMEAHAHMQRPMEGHGGGHAPQGR